MTDILDRVDYFLASPLPPLSHPAFTIQRADFWKCPQGDPFVSAFSAIENNQYTVAAVVMNPRDYADLRMFWRDVIDIEIKKSLLQRAYLWGALVLTPPGDRVPKGTVYFLADVPEQQEGTFALVEIKD